MPKSAECLNVSDDWNANLHILFLKGEEKVCQKFHGEILFDLVLS